MADRCLLCSITDRSQFRCDAITRRRFLLVEIAEAARAGVNNIQLREIDLGTQDLQSRAEVAIQTIPETPPSKNGQRTVLLINARTDVVLAVWGGGLPLRSE
jgi:thiamine monophosphate synthase